MVGMVLTDDTVFCLKGSFVMAQFKISLFRLSALAVLVAGFGLFSPSAQAGFQWNPAPKTAAPAVAPILAPDTGPAMPALTPSKVDADALNQMPSPPPPEMTAAEPIKKTPVSALPMEAPVVPMKKSDLPDAVGFGSDIPLALALHQIVPPQYGYVFDPAVNQGAKITWNGGKPWDMALNDALKPSGYSAVVEGNTVHVTAKTAPAHAAMGGDMPKPPLSPALSSDGAGPAAAIEPASKPVREVYVRRHSSSAEVEERIPGTPEDVKGHKTVTLASKDSGASSSDLWSKVNPKNWSDSEETSEEQVKPAPAQMSEKELHVPSPPDAMPAAQDAPPPPEHPPVALARDSGVITSSPDAAPVPVPETTAAMNPTDVRSWEAKKGDSLKSVLQQWSETAKVQLYWVPAQDYKLPQPIHIQGSYTDAVANALGAYGDNGPRPVGRLHPNLPTGPSVLIIEPSAS